MSVSYNTNGIVEICNASAESYNGLDLEICNMDGKIIYTESGTIWVQQFCNHINVR